MAGGSWRSYSCSSLGNTASQPPLSPSPSGSYLSLALRARLPPPPPPAPIHSPLRPRPSAQEGALASIRANRHLASPVPAPIRARRRRGFSNVIEAPPGAPRSLLFGKSQTGMEVASLPGGSVPGSGLGLGVGSSLSPPGCCNFPPSVRFPAGPGRALRASPPWSWRLRDGGCPDWLNTLTFEVCCGVRFRISC